mgnify:CR=1 FL=1
MSDLDAAEARLAAAVARLEKASEGLTPRDGSAAEGLAEENHTLKAERDRLAARVDALETALGELRTKTRAEIAAAVGEIDALLQADAPTRDVGSDDDADDDPGETLAAGPARAGGDAG